MAEMTGLKTKFLRESETTPGTYEAIAQVAGITPPQSEREVVEVEDLDPVDGVMKKLAGRLDPGEVSLTLNFDPTNTGHMDLEADFYAGEAHNYRIVLPNNYGWTFSGVVTGWSPSEIAASDVIQVEVTIAVSGKPTLGQITP